jgi:hypothetical protein
LVAEDYSRDRLDFGRVDVCLHSFLIHPEVLIVAEYRLVLLVLLFFPSFLLEVLDRLLNLSRVLPSIS